MTNLISRLKEGVPFRTERWPGNDGENHIADTTGASNTMKEAADVMADLVTGVKHSAAVISAIYEWLGRVEKAGGATSLSGIAECNAMLKSLRKNADRTDNLILRPLARAIEKAEGQA